MEHFPTSSYEIMNNIRFKKTSKTTNHRLTMSIFPAALAKCHVIPFSLQTQKKINPKNVTQVNGDPIIEETYRRGFVCFIRFFSKGLLKPQFARKKPDQDPDSELFVGFVSLPPPGTPHTREKKHKKNTV